MTFKFKRKDTAFYIVLLLIISVALVIRSSNLSKKGLCFWDEGIFFMGCKFLRWRIPNVYHQFLNHFGFNFSIPDPMHFPGYPVFLQKPVHVILLTFSSFIGGLHPLIGIYHSIFYGLLTIFLTGMIGKLLFGSYAGLLAAAWLTLEPYHIHYSRLALHETDSMALLLCAFFFLLWAHHKENKKFVFISGFFLMASFGASYRLLPFLFLFPLIDFYIWRRKNIRDTYMGRPMIFLLAYMVVFALLNLTYFSTFFPHYLWSQPGSYYELLKMKFFSSESTLDFKYPGFYWNMFIQFDGVIPVGTIVVALIFSPIKNVNGKIVFILSVIPIIIFSVVSTKLARTPTSILPFLALIVASFFSKYQTIIREHCLALKMIPLLMMGLIVINFTLKISPVLKIESGYQDCINFLKENKVDILMTTMKPVFASYMGNKHVQDIPWTLSQLYQIVKENKIRYVAIDWQKYVRYSPSARLIESSLLPVYAAKNNVALFFATLHENYLPSDVKLIREIDPTISYIKIYDLQKSLSDLKYLLNAKGILIEK